MSKIIGEALPNIPFEARPAGSQAVIWRSVQNPIIPQDLLSRSNSIFNSASVPFEGGFAGVFRCDDQARSMDLHIGFSEDGINWKIEEECLSFENEAENPEIFRYEYRYDPRVVKIDGRYYISWCNGYHGPTIGLAYTDDFKHFYQMENALLPYNRNGVLFPRKIQGRYMMISRPSDTGHTPFGDMFISQSEDLVFWGMHRHLMSTIKSNASAWQSTKIGAGPVPIETDEGWLLFYHGVLNSCNGFVYAFGAALLDLEEPWKILYRSQDYLMSPREIYERVGDVPNVIFPCAALSDAETGRIAIYYGAADTVTGLAFTELDLVLNWLKTHAL
ncbi:MAG: glycoside hydrolase family 130 protein [Eubacteriales bacterium]|nr:glycoside hydrolase family 130 protein [Eubacteriales bacterium]